MLKKHCPFLFLRCGGLGSKLNFESIPAAIKFINKKAANQFKRLSF
jgi:hypothetical protein